MREHHCPQNRHKEIYVLYGPAIDEGASGGNWSDQWILRVDRIAHQQDVANGEAIAVGDLLHRDEFIIDFCPFCGIHLDHNLAL
jgi:hypothetical protein